MRMCAPALIIINARFTTSKAISFAVLTSGFISSP